MSPNKANAFRLLVDESLHGDIAHFLRKDGHDAVVVPKGTRNGSVFRLAIKTRRVLLSGDKDFMDSRRFPPKLTKGIVVNRIHPAEPSLILPILMGLLETFSPKKLSGRLALLEPTGVRFP